MTRRPTVGEWACAPDAMIRRAVHDRDAGAEEDAYMAAFEELPTVWRLALWALWVGGSYRGAVCALYDLTPYRLNQIEEQAKGILIDAVCGGRSR